MEISDEVRIESRKGIQTMLKLSSQWRQKGEQSARKVEQQVYQKHQGERAAYEESVGAVVNTLKNVANYKYLSKTVAKKGFKLDAILRYACDNSALKQMEKAILERKLQKRQHRANPRMNRMPSPHYRLDQADVMNQAIQHQSAKVRSELKKA